MVTIVPVSSGALSAGVHLSSDNNTLSSQSSGLLWKLCKFDIMLDDCDAVSAMEDPRTLLFTMINTK
jgi:hypothetical protein